MAKSRFTEDFVKLVSLLDNKTEGNPNNLRAALETCPEVSVAIDQLSVMHRVLSEYRNTSPYKRIVQAHPDFLSALSRYESVWSNSWLKKLDWESGIDENTPIEIQIEKMLGPITENIEVLSSDHALDEWDFDPELHSASSDVNVAMEHLSYKMDDNPFFSRVQGAWKWLATTIGVNLESIEERWKEFPTIVVKQSVSDRHGLNEKRSLFAYLDEVKKAYVFGADLAAIAMCRAITEILIRYHYNDNDDHTPFRTLVSRAIETHRELVPFNLQAKIDEANYLLHFNCKLDIKSSNQARLLVRNWIHPLQILIDRAPENRSLEC